MFCLLILQNEPIHVGKKDYRCPFCQKKSGKKQHMQKHIRTHTGEKPFHCTFCHYACNALANLNTHIAKRHNETFKSV